MYLVIKLEYEVFNLVVIGRVEYPAFEYGVPLSSPTFVSQSVDVP